MQRISAATVPEMPWSGHFGEVIGSDAMKLLAFINAAKSSPFARIKQAQLTSVII
jgi:hypothetical protein